MAILLPLTGQRADLGQQLLQAARLALKGDPGFVLDALDTGGTAEGAAKAAATAVSGGDGLVLGPLTSAETAAVAPITRKAGIPVLAFTNDTSQCQPGVWTLGISPDQQIQRLVVALQAQGKTRFASLLPDSDFGRAMARAFTDVAARQGLPEPTIKMHASGMAAITSAARELSDYANRRGPIDARIRAARALGTADGRREAAELARTPVPPPPFDALLLADTGEALQEIAAVLPYYDIDHTLVQIIGPALWADPGSGSGTLGGALYAAPDSNQREAFDRDYLAQNGANPSPVADLAYDAAAVARIVMGPRGFDQSALTQSAGFVGSDGWIIFYPDGHVGRGLAVFRIERGIRDMVEPAPESAAAPGL
jgi:hypothetical protein